MFARIFKWVDQRWPLSAMVRLALVEEMPGGASYAYVFGSSTLIVFLLQVVTGIWQIFYYVPTLDHAYPSLTYLWTEVPLGWFIHQMHYWGAQAMIVLVICHVSQVFLWGAYKRPHELKWLTGVLLFLFTMTMSLTGGVLPWDKRAYWVIEVASSAAGTVPVVGDVAKRLMLGGATIGQLALSRFFVTHAVVLPVLILIVAGVHLIALRAVGSAGPFDAAKRRSTGPFWPDQVYEDGLAGALIFFVLVTLCVYAPEPFFGMADPLDSTYIPKPEWNFLFFYQALKFFPGPLEPLATIGIPLIGTLGLIFLPFYDRNPERSPAQRPLAMVFYFVILMAFILLTIAGAASKTGVSAAATTSGTPAPASSSASLPPGEESGKALFQSQGCVACHKINDVGGTVGPDLSGEGLRGRDRPYLTTQIRNPRANDPTTVMPPFPVLTDKQVSDLADYLLSLKGSAGETASVQPSPSAPLSADKAAAASAGPDQAAASASARETTGTAAAIIGSASHGEILFSQVCAACHGPEGTDDVPNPGSADGKVPPLNPIDRELFAADPKVFAQKIDLFIQHGSTPEGPHPALHMLAFGDTNALTQPQIADLEAYVMSLNGVDRGQLSNPGVDPMAFFWAVAALFGITGLALGGLWSKRTAKRGEKSK